MSAAAKTTQLPAAQHAGETPLCAQAGACEADSLEPPGTVGMREIGMLLGIRERADIPETLWLDMAGKNDMTGMAAGTPPNAIVISITDSGDLTTDPTSYLDAEHPTATVATPACRRATTCSLDVPIRTARIGATVVTSLRIAMSAPTAWTATAVSADTGQIDTSNMETAGVEIAHVDTAVSTRPTNEDCNIALRQASPQVVPAPAREARLAVVPVLQEVPPSRAVPPRRLVLHQPGRITL